MASSEPLSHPRIAAAAERTPGVTSLVTENGVRLAAADLHRSRGNTERWPCSGSGLVLGFGNIPPSAVSAFAAHPLSPGARHEWI